MTQEELNNLEKLVNLEGNEDAVKKLVDYYESNGDLEKAIDYLREKGIAKAAKKESRIAAEGLANIYTNAKKADIDHRWQTGHNE